MNNSEKEKRKELFYELYKYFESAYYYELGFYLLNKKSQATIEDLLKIVDSLGITSSESVTEPKEN